MRKPYLERRQRRATPVYDPILVLHQHVRIGVPTLDPLKQLPPAINRIGMIVGPPFVLLLLTTTAIAYPVLVGRRNRITVYEYKLKPLCNVCNTPHVTHVWEGTRYCAEHAAVEFVSAALERTVETRPELLSGA